MQISETYARAAAQYHPKPSLRRMCEIEAYLKHDEAQRDPSFDVDSAQLLVCEFETSGTYFLCAVSASQVRYLCDDDAFHSRAQMGKT